MCKAECPDCGPYGPIAETRSANKRFLARLILCRCFRCLQCGRRFLTPMESSLIRRYFLAPLKAMSMFF